jgi:glycosyltransferase involved in cell wall biosynthesis
MIQNTDIPQQVVGLFDGDTDLRPVIVSIRCATYNHEPYIRQTLDGFVMQKTNFRFEAIVHDDASTDGTAAIIREYAEKYPDIIKPIYETENQYSKHDGSLNRIMESAMRGKYVALCEGDDYWVDPLKLQKQVDIMEKDGKIGLIYTNLNMYNQATGTMEYNCITSGKLKRSYSFKDHLINQGFIAPPTWLVRKELWSYHYGVPIDGTFCIALEAFAESKVFFLDEPTAVYRCLPESVSHTKSLKKALIWNKQIQDIIEFYKNRYPHLLTKDDLLMLDFIKFGSVYQLAIIYNEKVFIEEARLFFKKNFYYKQYMVIEILKYCRLAKFLLKYKFRRKGWAI